MNLLEAGAHVALVARTKVELDKIAQRYPFKASVYAYDLSDPMQINICFKKVTRENTHFLTLRRFIDH